MAPSAAASAVDHTANAKDVCTQLKTFFVKTLFADSNDRAALQNAVNDAMNGKTGASAQAAALAVTKQYLTSAFVKIKDIAAKAEDPELKQNMLATEADFEQAVNSITSLNDVGAYAGPLVAKLKAVDTTAESKKVTEICTAAGVTIGQ